MFISKGNLSTFSYGTTCGWTTINFVDFQNENSTLPAGQLSLKEATLVGSLHYVGALIGNFAIFLMSEEFGNKRTIHCLSIPLIVSSYFILCSI